MQDLSAIAALRLCSAALRTVDRFRSQNHKAYSMPLSVARFEPLEVLTDDAKAPALRVIVSVLVGNSVGAAYADLKLNETSEQQEDTLRHAFHAARKQAEAK